MKKILLALIIAAVIFTGTVSASAGNPPELPASFFGDAKNASGIDLPAGTVITAYCSGQLFTYELTEDGIIGEPGTFGDKFLVSPNEVSDDYVEFYVGSVRAEDEVEFKSGTSKEIHLVFDVAINDVREVENNTVPGGNWSAKTKAEVVYEFGAGSSVYAPEISNGGKNITIGTDEKDVILVEKKDDDSWITVDGAYLNSDGLLIIPEGTSGSLKVTFTGRCLGDVTGDGRILINDATSILSYRTGLIFTDAQMFYADVNGDSRVLINDATAILSYRTGAVNEHYLHQ